MFEARDMKVKPPDHEDIAGLMDLGDRQTPGVTTGERRGKAKRRVPATDRRRARPGEARTEQHNVRVTLNLVHAMQDVMVTLDLTKAELTERALKFYIAAVRKGETNAGLEEETTGLGLITAA
jgi:hypothetical protein